ALDRAATPSLVTAGARAGDPACRQALQLFCRLYGSEAGNLALKVLPTGGVWVAGGIAAKILPELQDGRFREALLDKGRMRRHLRYDPQAPRSEDRDRFVLSAGHASMLIYSLLHLAGFDVTMEDIKAFRQYGSRTPGHPEYRLTPGVEATTGPLGQGIANAVGMALSLKMLAARVGEGLIDGYVYGICSDGDLMEGVSAEASSLAGHLHLGNLIFRYHDN